MKKINKGVYPTMVTPFKDGEIDYQAVDQILDYYIKSGCAGVFAVCQSSEMFFLSLNERIELAKHIVRYVDGRMNVVASGHISDSFEDQVKEINEIWKTGIDAFVLVSNRLDLNNESDEIFIENGNKLLKALDENIVLGIYECPLPYKRLLTPKIIEWMKNTNRFVFIKDTCCNIETISNRLEQLKDSNIMLFNANGQTLYDSILKGAAGYSGIMANFICKDIVWMINNIDDKDAEIYGKTFAFYSFIENKAYPSTGKYALSLRGINLSIECRNNADKNITDYDKNLVKKLLSLGRE